MVEEVGVEPILHGRQWNPVECHSNKINNLAISPSMYIHPGFRKVGLKVGTNKNSLQPSNYGVAAICSNIQG